MPTAKSLTSYLGGVQICPHIADLDYDNENVAVGTGEEYSHSIALLQKAQQISSGFYYLQDGSVMFLKHNPFSKAKGGGDGIGCTKAGKGVKLMVLVDARGLPVAVDTCSASPHECTLVQELFVFMVTSTSPERVIGDRAYDSDKLADELAARGTELIAPNRRNRKQKTQDGRKLHRYRRRWTVERTIAWFQNYRRLCIRWEKSTAMFAGFLHLSFWDRFYPKIGRNSPYTSPTIRGTTNTRTTTARTIRPNRDDRCEGC